MSYQLWKLDDGKPTFVGADERPEGLDVLVRRLPKGTTVAKARDGLVIASNGSEAQLKLFRTAVAEAWRRAGGAPPAPLQVPTEAPRRQLESLRFGRGKRREEEVDEEEAPPAPVAPKPAKVSRPAATRPPLARRRTTSVASGTLTSTPIAPPAVDDSRTVPSPSRLAPVPVDAPAPASARAELVEFEQVRDDANVAGVAALREADVAAAKIADLQRLLGQVTNERDAHRDRIEAAEHRVEQLRGEVEGLTTDLGVARHDLARVTAQSNELAGERDEARTEKLEALGAEAFAWDLVDLAMTTDLAAVIEARAETTEVLRQAGELSRLLGAAREELDALRAAAPVSAVPASVLLDELMLERIAQQAARRAVALQGDAAKLARLAQEHGGADAVARIVEGAMALRKAVG